MLVCERHTMIILSKMANGGDPSVCFILYQNDRNWQMLLTCNENVSVIIENWIRKSNRFGGTIRARSILSSIGCKYKFFVKVQRFHITVT